eukprot:snap_masked-scaffold_3-processed-gene-12.16-mRNA-1 protein AED:0.15 eAED:0.15 QI:0/0/0/1/1/1/2/0/748
MYKFWSSDEEDDDIKQRIPSRKRPLVSCDNNTSISLFSKLMDKKINKSNPKPVSSFLVTPSKPKAEINRKKFGISPQAKKLSFAALKDLTPEQTKEEHFQDTIWYPDEGFYQERPGFKNLSRKRIILDNKFYIPGYIVHYLKEFQIEGIKFMYKHIREGSNCILNDSMGLGKTLQTIGLLATILQKTGTIRDSKFTISNFVCLVLCPASLVSQWKNELCKWGHFESREVKVMSYGRFRSDLQDIMYVRVQLLVLDEIHILKNNKSALSKSIAQFILELKDQKRKSVLSPGYPTNLFSVIGLTGTLFQNDFKEVFSICSLASSHNIFKDWIIFKNEFVKPIQRARNFRLNDTDRIAGLQKEKELRDILLTFILRRDKTMPSVQKVLKLPNKYVTDVFCELSPLQHRVYSMVLKTTEAQSILQRKIKVTETYLKGYLFNKSHENSKTCPKCPICLGFPMLTLLRQVSNHVDLVPLDYLKELKILTTPSMMQRSGKLTVLQNMLRKWYAERKKVLIFSTSVLMLNILEVFCSAKSYIVHRLDGSMSKKERQDNVTRFLNDIDAFVFLISAKAGGVGLNLTRASVVVNFDPSWNPALDMQTQDRAFRFGQENTVQVFRLFSKNSVEENIYILQKTKLDLSRAVDVSKETQEVFRNDKVYKTAYVSGFDTLLHFDFNRLPPTVTNPTMITKCCNDEFLRKSIRAEEKFKEELTKQIHNAQHFTSKENVAQCRSKLQVPNLNGGLSMLKLYIVR